MENINAENDYFGLLYKLANYCEDSIFTIQRSLDEKNIEMLQLLHVDSFDSRNKAIQHKIHEAFSSQLKITLFTTLLNATKHLIINNENIKSLPDSSPCELETILWILDKLGNSYFQVQIKHIFECVYGKENLERLEQYLNLDPETLAQGSQLPVEPCSIDEYVKNMQDLYTPWFEKNPLYLNRTAPKTRMKAYSSFKVSNHHNANIPKRTDWKENDNLDALIQGSWQKLSRKDSKREAKENGSINLHDQSGLKKGYYHRTSIVHSLALQFEQECLIKSSKTFDLNQVNSNLKISMIKGLCKKNIEYYDQIEPELASAGKLFVDEVFSPEIGSLTSNIAEFPIAQKIVWKRIQEIYKDKTIKVCSNDIGPNDIQQGELGDCYLLSALSVLAEQKSFIKRLFHSKNASPTGCYSIWLCDSGEWKNIIIDDYIPCKVSPLQGLAPCFSKSKSDDIWVILLEKAFSKLFGNYHNIDGGILSEAMTVLTGAPAKHFKEKKDSLPLTDQLWRFLKDSLSNKYPITAASRGESMIGQHRHVSVVSNHAYAVLEIKELESIIPEEKTGSNKPRSANKRVQLPAIAKNRVVNSDVKEKSDQRIIKMRNPWGLHIGRDEEWRERSQALSSLVSSAIESDDSIREEEEGGVFWIALDDFARSFKSICACEIHEDYYFSFIRLGEYKGQSHFIAKMELYSSGLVYLSVQQKMKKHFRKNDSYQYSFCRVILGQVDQQGKVISVIDGKYKANQSIVIREKLNKGEYIVVIEVDWVQKFYNEVVVTAYAKTKANFHEEPLNNYDVFSLYEGFLKAALNKPKDKKLGKPKQYENGEIKYDIWKYKVEKFGLVGLFFCNKEEKIALNSRLEIQKFDNMELYMPGSKETHTVDLKLEPGSEKMVIFKARIEDASLERELDVCEAAKTKAFAYEYGEMFRLSNVYTSDQLKELCIEKGTKIQRFLNGMIEVYKFTYLGGVVEYYVNHHENKTFKQEITFEAQNILVNGKEPENMAVLVPPKKDYILDMKVKDMYKGSKFTRKTRPLLI